MDDPAAQTPDWSPASLPNRLLTPDAIVDRRPLPWLAVALILLLALSLRLLMATKVDVLCNDGVLYAQLAEAIEKGDLVNGTREVRLNTLSVLLAILHGAGLSWEMAGKCQGIFCGTLAILPLFGWLRRQYNDRLAIISCVLYAAHPTVVKWSPEVVRDPSFSLFAAATLYFSWRAACELRPRFYAAAGLMFVLAVHTRVEGLFLILPMLAWSARHSLALAERRWRPWAGLANTAVVCGVLFLAIGGLVRYQTGHWDSIRSSPIALAVDFSQRLIASAQKEQQEKPAQQGAQADGSGAEGHAPAASAPPPPAPVVTGPQPVEVSSKRRAYILLNTLERGLSPFYALLMFLGIGCGWRIWARSDHQPLFVVCLAVIAGMWIHLGYAGISSTRYVMTIIMLSLPFVAIGLLALSRAISYLAAFTLQRNWQQQTVLACLLTALVLFGTGVIAQRYVAHRAAQARVSRWLLAQNGPQLRVLGNDELRAIVGHYAQSEFRSLPGQFDYEQLRTTIDSYQPDFVILSDSLMSPQLAEQLRRCERELEFRLVDAPEAESAEARIVLLERKSPRPELARRNAAPLSKHQ